MKNNNLRVITGIFFAAATALPQTASAFFNNEVETPVVQRATAAYVPSTLSKQATVRLTPSFGIRNVASSGQHTGIASGDKTGRAGNLWFTGGFTSYDNDFNGTTYDADIRNFIVGYDAAYRQNIILGVALTYEEANSHSSLQTTNARDGFGISPYIGVKLSEYLIFDASLGYAPNMSGRLTDLSGTLTLVDLHPDTDRVQASVNLNGYKPVTDKALFSWHTGINYSRDKTTNAVSALNNIDYGGTSKLTQGYVRGQMTYSAGNVETYVSLEYSHDFDNPEDLSVFGLSEDDNQFVLNIGANGKVGNSGFLNFDFKLIEDRDYVDHYAVQASYSMPF